VSVLSYLRAPWWSANATVTATVDADYLAAWLCDIRPGRPIRATSGSFSASIANPSGSVDVIVVGNHNLDAGLGIAIDGDIDASMTVPALPPDGIPLNPFTLAGSPGTAATLTLAVSGNSRDVVIGEFAAGELRSIGLPQLSTHRLEHAHKNIEPNVDVSSVLPYDKGVAMRRLIGRYILTNTEKEAVEDWYRAERGGSRPSVIIPELDVNDAWFTRFAEPPTFTPIVGSDDRSELLWAADLTFQELPRSRW
jgi:hypothetical protein